MCRVSAVGVGPPEQSTIQNFRYRKFPGKVSECFEHLNSSTCHLLFKNNLIRALWGFRICRAVIFLTTFHEPVTKPLRKALGTGCLSRHLLHILIATMKMLFSSHRPLPFNVRKQDTVVGRKAEGNYFKKDSVYILR